MRYDLAFFLCCCKSFLGAPHKKGGGGGGSGEQQQQQHDNEEEEEDFYALLGLERDASPDDIKRAYKKQSLLMHPDKLAQRGMTVTPESQARFTRMKEAYETLSDSHKRETYDAIGERGMKWLEEPFSIDPQELAHNFAKSSVLDRSKIFAIFVAIAVSVLLLPVLVCLHVDGAFGPNASWMATLVPLWIWNSFITFYHCRVIMMGPIPRPDHVAPEEWVDPLPMKRRYMSFGRFLLIFLFEVLAALKLDSSVPFPWFFIFLPLYLWEGTTLYKKWPVARMRIVTVEDLEAALGKPFSQFTPAERELIGRRYSVVPSAESPEMEAATRLKARARHDIVKSAFRVLFVSAVVLQLDVGISWNWWVVFLPFWIMTALICYANYQAFAEVQAVAMEKDPTLFSNLPGMPPSNKADEEMGMGGGAGAGEGGAAAAAATTTTSYGAVASDGTPKPPPQPLTEEEREELKAQVMASSSRLCSKCCSQGFLLFIVFLFVAKLQGAGFSSLWIISPFLLVAGIILFILGCAIFGITEVPTDGLDFDAADFGRGSAPGAAGTANPTETTPPSSSAYIPPPPTAYEPDPATTTNEGSASINSGAPAAAAATTTDAPVPPPSMDPVLQSRMRTMDAPDAAMASHALSQRESSIGSPSQPATKQDQQQEPSDDEVQPGELHELD